MSVDVGKAQGHLDLDIKNWGSKLKTAISELKTFGSTSTAMTGKMLTQQGKLVSGVGDKLTKSITKPALAAGAALAGLTIAKGFKRMEMLDNAKRKLEALDNSGKDVQSIMATVGTVVDKTAYTSAEAVSVAAGAVGAGVQKGKELEKYLSAVGDAAAIAGTDFQSMGAIFNKVAARGKVTAREIMQLSNSGIPAFNLLAKATGKSMDEIQTAVRKGEIGVDDLVKAINSGMPNAARVIGSKTIQGAITNINAYIGKMGEAFLGATDDADSFAGKLLPILNNLVDYMANEGVNKAKEFGEKLGSAFEGVVNFFTKTPTGILKFGAAFALGSGPVLKLVGSLMQARGAVLSFQAANKGMTITQGVLNGKLTMSQAIWGGLTTSQAAATTSMTVDTAATEANAAAKESQVIASEADTIAIGEEAVAAATDTTAKVAEATATETAAVAQTGLNAAMSAFPAALLIAGIATLRVSIVSLINHFKSLDGSQTEAYKSLQEAQKQRADAVSSIESQAVVAERYASQIEKLNQKEKLSNSEKEKMKGYVDALNQAMGETVVTIDEETGKVVESTNKIRDKIAALKEEAQAKAYASNYQQTVQEEIELTDKLETATQALADKRKELSKGGIDPKEQGILNDMQTEINGYTKALEKNKAEQEKWADKIDGGNKKAEKSTKKTTKNIEKEHSNMSKKVPKSADKMSKDVAKAMEMKEAQSKAKSSGNKMVNNVKNPLQKANLSPLGTKMGNQFTNALGKTKSRQAGQTVGKNAKSGLEKGSDGAEKAGSFFGSGFISGIKAWWDKASAAGYKLGKAAESGLKQGTAEQSPSKTAKKAGSYFGQGFDIGINGHKMTVSKSAEKLGKSAVKGLKKAVKEHNYSEIGSEMIDKFSDGIDKRIEKAKKTAKKAIDEATKKLGDKKQGEKAGKELMETYSKALKKYGENAKKAVEKVVTDITEKYQQAYDDLQSATESFTSSWQGLDVILGDEETGYTLRNWDEATTTLNTIYEKLTQIQGISTPEIMNQILEMDVEEQQKFLDLLTSAPDPAEYLKSWEEYRKLTEEYSKTFFDKGVEDIDKNYLQEVKKAVNQLPKQLEEVGVNAVQGLMDGMGKMKGALQSKARSLAAAAVAAMMAELDENSPSKVTMEVGKFAGQGVAIGLDNEKKNVEKSATSIAKTIQDGLMFDTKKVAKNTKDQLKQIESAYKGFDWKGMKQIVDSNINVQSMTKLDDSDKFDYDKMKAAFMESGEIIGAMIDEAVRESMTNFTMKVDGRDFGRIVREVK